MNAGVKFACIDLMRLRNALRCRRRANLKGRREKKKGKERSAAGRAFPV